MFYTARISKFQLFPMVDHILSTLQIWVYIDELKREEMLEDEFGSIEELSKKFEFKIINDYHWDLSAMQGRRCQVEKTSFGFHFARYAD